MNIDLRFQEWSLVLAGANVRQYDDHAHTLRVTGDLPEGWQWKLYASVFSEAYFNAIPLTEAEGVLSAVLTRDDLAFGDTTYTLQLVGEHEAARRHTNPVRLYVGASLSGDGVWPEVPRSFTEAEAAASDAAQCAVAAAAAAEAARDDPELQRQLEDLDFRLGNIELDAEAHIANADIHVSAADRARWDAGGGSTVEVISMTNGDIQPLFVDMLSGNWLGSQNAAYASSAENAEKYFTFSAAAGADTVSVTGGTASLASLTRNQWWRGIVEYDDGTCVPTMVSYQETADTLRIFPALTATVSNGTIMPSMFSIHATSLGYKWYAQHVYKANAKHCFKSKPIARYRAWNSDPIPLEKINSFWWGENNGNVQRTLQVCNPTVKHLHMNIDRSASAATPKGFSWTVDVGGKAGYAEILMSGNYAADFFEFPQDEGFVIELYQDGVLTETYHKTTVHYERICLDFSACETIELRVCATGNSVTHTIELTEVSVWETGAFDRTELLPFGSVPAQLFDSWGEQFGGATATEFKRLHSRKLGVTAPWENHSQGGATSAWGRAWFYENVVKYHPTHVLIDFVINDSNSRGTSGFAQTVAGPDGTKYDNILTVEEYIANMIAMIHMSIAAGIQPIICLAPYGENEKPDWSCRLIDAWAGNAQNS